MVKQRWWLCCLACRPGRTITTLCDALLMSMLKTLTNILSALAIFLYVSVAWGIEQLEMTSPIELSVQMPDFDAAYKSKIASTSSGILVVVYGDALENDPSHYVFDAKQGSLRPARDVFISSCDSVNADCSITTNWSTPVNIANTALLSSMQTDWRGDGVRDDYRGDSDNPHLFVSGSHVVVTWGDKYCPGGAQRSVTYLEFDNRTIPMSCLYVAHSSQNYGDSNGWTVDRLTDGSRDVKQDSSKGISSGVWAVSWQEDPLGLQPGEADGPGEGSSGAKTSHGTDIWYTYSANVANAVADIGVWATPVRVTDNHTGFGLSGSFNPIRDVAGNFVDTSQIEKGNTGASRANLQVVGGSNPPLTVIAYEETKGSVGLDEGKFLRYHVFPYNQPPSSATDKAGCIISDPAENARRARFVSQTTAASDSGLRFAIFWRQGLYDKGGPADVMLRLGYQTTAAGSTGLHPADLYPPLDANCFALDYASAINLVSAAPLNISSHTPTATTDNLQDNSDANRLENARAHRAVLRNSDLYVGYIYANDGVVAAATDLENYNFFIRHFTAADGVWGSPVNLSNITNTAINVLEPRLLGMPGNGPGCTDPANITRPENCQNKNVLVAAWGTETNVYDHIGGSENLDVYITRTTDRAAHWEPVSLLAAGPAAQGETQLRVTPDGSRIFAVWNETSAGATNSLFSVATPVTLLSDIALSVTEIPASIYAGSLVDIDYRVENIGPDPAYDIRLQIALPPSTTYLSAADACSHDAGTVTCLLGDMDANSSIAIPVSLQSSSVTPLTFTATIESFGLEDPDLSNNQLTSVVNATMASDVELAVISHPAQVDVGTAATITYRLSNAGPSPAEAIRLTLPLPDGASYIASSPAICSVSAAEIGCDVGSLAAGDATDVAIEFAIEIAGQTSVNASVSATQFDPVMTNNQTLTLITAIPHADLSVRLTSSRGKLDEGSQTRITVELINQGPQISSGAELTIHTPAGWSQRALTASQGTCRVSAAAFICDVGGLDVGDAAIIQLDGTVDNRTTVAFTTNVSALEDDPDLSNNSDTVSVIFTKDKTFVQQVFGCSLGHTIQAQAAFDPTLPLLLLIAFYHIGRRRYRHGH